MAAQVPAGGSSPDECGWRWGEGKEEVEPCDGSTTSRNPTREGIKRTGEGGEERLVGAD